MQKVTTNEHHTSNENCTTNEQPSFDLGKEQKNLYFETFALKNVNTNQ